MVSLDVAVFDGANVNFTLVKVPDPVLRDQAMIDGIMAGAVMQFRRPVVLMGADGRETYGRDELRGFLHYVNTDRLPWARLPFEV
ncbi:MAG: hypothetical protein J0H62_07405 [Rhizobiales bacterium]|nr:hypothetical protein [Hyphomicrobiales bacterium]